MKCKLVLVKKEVAVASDGQAVLDDGCNNTAVDPSIELCLVRVIGPWSESRHREEA